MNQERFEALRKLNPLQAVQAWINGDWGLGDEDALIEAIRRNPKVQGWSDEEIIEIMLGAMDEELSAAQAFERLTRATRYFPAEGDEDEDESDEPI